MRLPISVFTPALFLAGVLLGASCSAVIAAEAGDRKFAPAPGDPPAKSDLDGVMGEDGSESTPSPGDPFAEPDPSDAGGECWVMEREGESVFDGDDSDDACDDDPAAGDDSDAQSEACAPQENAFEPDELEGPINVIFFGHTLLQDVDGTRSAVGGVSVTIFDRTGANLGTTFSAPNTGYFCILVTGQPGSTWYYEFELLPGQVGRLPMIPSPRHTRNWCWPSPRIYAEGGNFIWRRF